jgi:hypothetical protein
MKIGESQALETGFDSDILLLLGPDKVEVKTHRFILSFFSPVLRKAINSSKDGKGCLPDEYPAFFKMLLKVFDYF